MASVGGLGLPVIDQVKKSCQEHPTAQIGHHVLIAVHLAGLVLHASVILSSSELILSICFKLNGCKQPLCDSSQRTDRSLSQPAET